MAEYFDLVLDTTAPEESHYFLPSNTFFKAPITLNLAQNEDIAFMKFWTNENMVGTINDTNYPT